MIYRSMRPEEVAAVCDLVARAFGEFVAPDYSDEGVEEFLKYADPSALSARPATRWQANHFVLVTEDESSLAGMVEFRNHDHISLLFVDKPYQRQGIASELVRRGIEICRTHRPDVGVITVNSSPNAVEAYKRLGFVASAPEQAVHGIRFIPMSLVLEP